MRSVMTKQAAVKELCGQNRTRHFYAGRDGMVGVQVQSGYSQVVRWYAFLFLTGSERLTIGLTLKGETPTDCGATLYRLPVSA